MPVCSIDMTMCLSMTIVSSIFQTLWAEYLCQTRTSAKFRSIWDRAMKVNVPADLGSNNLDNGSMS